jgi:hypothetical protein
MGRYCAWEVAWHLAHLQPRQAFRRLSPNGASPSAPTITPSPAARSSPRGKGLGDGGRPSNPLRIYYPSTQQLKQAFAPFATLTRVWPLGLFLPPTYLESLTRRAWFPFRLFAALDRRLPIPLWADHTVYELTRLN